MLKQIEATICTAITALNANTKALEHIDMSGDARRLANAQIAENHDTVRRLREILA